MNRRLCSVAFAATLAATAAWLPATASADTVQIGSTLNFPAVPALCTGCVAVQNGASAGLSTHPFKSPANGVVTSWSVRSGDTGAIYNLRILRQASPTTFLGVGTSPVAIAVTSSANAVHTSSTSLAISNGDSIGLQMNPMHDIPDHFTGNNADVDAWAFPPFADGTQGSFTGTQGHELLLQATVSFCNVPNVHKLKKVNAKQALASADCGVKVKKKETHKKKFRGKVLKQKKAPGTTAAPGTVIAIVIGQK
jgi:PASTA domain